MISLFNSFATLQVPIIHIAVFADMTSGLSGVALLAVINSVLQHQASINFFGPVFADLCISFLSARLCSEYILTYLGQNAIRDLRLKLSHQILELPLAKLQELGSGKVLVNLSEDVSAISEAFMRITALMRECCRNYGYLGLLIDLLWVVIGALFIGVIKLYQFLGEEQ